jgi:1-acyl-sn-glycerol-3-phosphate acyltransferase
MRPNYQMRASMRYLHRLASVAYMALIYMICCVVAPIVLLPVCIVARLTHRPSACWDWVTHQLFFRLIRLRYRVHGTFIDSGFILANHRTWADFGYDPYVSRSAIVGRALGFASMIGLALLGFVEQRCIVLRRTRSRHYTFEVIRRFQNANGPYSQRILIWPEGTRRSHTSLTLAETALLLKPGLLKSIYQHHRSPVQIMLSNNKERVFDEKRLHVGIGWTIDTRLSDAINPRDFATFDAFFERVCADWHGLFQTLYTDGDARVQSLQ